ncbi:polysaccharide deacetylase family protein [Aromatoleum evansii]|uniref:Polysaccharide deacetylase family protein n=1 Tax=Aromatoleum evansii TaxID=59406 RepID=A0ABZ1AI51_AROEV|nr:polysaccharide deacetylase family protein [Aromatoleum evansii]
MKIDPISSALHRRGGSHGPVVLMYHSVETTGGTPAWPWAVSARRFAAQLDFLKDEGYATPTVAELAAYAQPPAGRTAVITFDDGYANNLAACEALHARGMRATWFVVTGSLGCTPSWPDDGRPAGCLLTAPELREMQAAGMEVGSHTVNHARLPTLDDDAIARELRDSRSALEDVLGAAVSSFAYPYGAWDARCADAVRSAGYAVACTTRTGWALRDGNPYSVRRLTVFNHDTTSSLARKLYFGGHEVAWPDVVRCALRRLRA